MTDKYLVKFLKFTFKNVFSNIVRTLKIIIFVQKKVLLNVPRKLFLIVVDVVAINDILLL